MTRDTECPECGGLGKTMQCGTLVPCEDCDATGRVEAVMIYDYHGAFLDEAESFAPYLLAVPKAHRAPHTTTEAA